MLNGGGGGFFGFFGGGSSSGSSGGIVVVVFGFGIGFGFVVFIILVISSFCLICKNLMVCLWCYVVVKIKMVCDVVVIGKNGMDDF